MKHSAGKIIKKILRIILLILAVVGFVFLFSESYVAFMSRGRIHDATEYLPEGRVGLVLGCSRILPNGRQNQYFVKRMDAAARLWESGKITCLIVSGDNSHTLYNEPEDMKMALMERGVPEDRIVCDYAGLRTLDSVLRAREIFGTDSFIVVSQPFHNKRAVTIGRFHGMDVSAYNADNIHSLVFRTKNAIRERLARLAMLVDLWIRDKQPKYLGDPVPLPDSNAV